MANILEKYEKLSQLDTDFSDIKFEGEKYCISLSGGVDSMVLLDLLVKQNKKVIAIHINYNNREETGLEEKFLEEYCAKLSVEFICHRFSITRGSIRRNEYEDMTKKVKFALYKDILEKNNIRSILLAHHKDDIIENILTNFCRGRNFLDLSVIKYENVILGVTITRPLLNYYKSDIYNYAHFYEIPYFLDTTPDWSVRGKLRRQIFPMLHTAFNGLKPNLLHISKDSEEWSDLLNRKIINKYYNTIVCHENIANLPIEEAPFENYRHYPLCFWQEILTRLYHYYGRAAPSRKALIIFKEGLIDNTDKTMMLNKSSKVKICNDTYMIRIQFLM